MARVERAVHRPRQPVCGREPACWSSTAPRSTRINAIDEAITVGDACRAFKAVVAGRDDRHRQDHPLSRCRRDFCSGRCRSRRRRRAPCASRPIPAQGVGVVSTLLPGLKPSVVDKTLGVLGERARAGRRGDHRRRSACRTTAAARRRRHSADVHRRTARSRHRLRRLGHRRPPRRHPGRRSRPRAARSRISACRSIPAICLLVGALDGKPVIGAPGCARSPKENGFDWVLQRLLAGVAGHPRRHRRAWASAGF